MPRPGGFHDIRYPHAFYIGISYYRTPSFIRWAPGEYPCIGVKGGTNTRKTMGVLRPALEDLTMHGYPCVYVSVRIDDIRHITEPNRNQRDINELFMFHSWYFLQRGARTQGFDPYDITVFIPPFETSDKKRIAKLVNLPEERIKPFKIPVPYTKLKDLLGLYGSKETLQTQYFKESEEIWDDVRSRVKNAEEFKKALEVELKPEITPSAVTTLKKLTKDLALKVKTAFDKETVERALASFEFDLTVMVEEEEISEKVARELLAKATELVDMGARPGKMVRELYGTIRKYSATMGITSETYKLGLIKRIVRWVDKGYLGFENPLKDCLSEPGHLTIMLFPFGLTVREVALLDIFLDTVLATIIDIEGSREARRLPGYFLAIDDMGAFTRHDVGELVAPTLDFIALRIARGLRLVRMYITQSDEDLTRSLKGSSSEVGAFNWKILTTATPFRDCYGMRTRFGTTAFVYAPEVRVDINTERMERLRKWSVGLRPPLSAYTEGGAGR